MMLVNPCDPVFDHCDEGDSFVDMGCDIVAEVMVQNWDDGIAMFDTSEENEAEDESIDLIKSFLTPKEETQFPLLPIEEEVAEQTISTPPLASKEIVEDNTDVSHDLASCAKAMRISYQLL